eukprot:4891424-Pyramimonas_sp.AAC.2
MAAGPKLEPRVRVGTPHNQPAPHRGGYISSISYGAHPRPRVSRLLRAPLPLFGTTSKCGNVIQCDTM